MHHQCQFCFISLQNQRKIHPAQEKLDFGTYVQNFFFNFSEYEKQLFTGKCHILDLRR